MTFGLPRTKILNHANNYTPNVRSDVRRIAECVATVVLQLIDLLVILFAVVVILVSMLRQCSISSIIQEIDFFKRT